ncbi:hypothetical protein TVAG_321350 [Trichomonas vaginalis G3]|uniref:VWFA domain-containing protein n=1 Tax=Trichomonas vaginalis (strain ATCC PRA-98 / G3) TaxID=412133 RepID=A2FK58_TRIV3|nr:proteasome assembly [Trichomonas vaginalis G3]EAX94698.1 hypothetical protein TVAG_321350 [Trichomonas vaginalis G3]KAI5504128.1 proteasome assembly [Trichomonas vaginalis G3]|eukprot:XP_001307628.1 hypothetical protein [Trichomonas vaginalis G3]
MSSDPRSIVMIIDNSSTSINGDFFPTRIEAQRKAVNQLATYIFSLNSNSQVAVYTAGSKEFGIRVSLVSSSSKILPVISQISCGGNLRLETSIKQALIAFHFIEHKCSKSILCFVGGPNDINENNSQIIAQKCKKESADLHILTFGNNVPNVPLLEKLAKSVSPKSIFINLPIDSGDPLVISDAILKSDLGPGEKNARLELKAISNVDPALTQELMLALQSHQAGKEMEEMNLKKRRKAKKK